MSSLDPLGNHCDRVVRIHLRRIHDTKCDIAVSVRFAQQVYGRHGIHFQIASVATVAMSPSDHERFATQETFCLPNMGNDERDEIYARFGVQDFASVTAFTIKAFADPFNRPSPFVTVGCAAHAPHRAAVYIGSYADPWTLAHEVGHVLLGDHLNHSEAPNNIMRPVEDRRSPLAPAFDPEQLVYMRRSPYLLPC